jgi:light-regulated signal transduction histidine kinase (bacteriophytochrome)
MIRLLTPRLEHQERAIDTLTAFIRDVEHDVLSVATALQAHVDLLCEEQPSTGSPSVRFAALNRTIARVITDITYLSSVSELAATPPPKQKLILEGLIEEIARETQSAFTSRHVSLCCQIVAGTAVTCNTGPLKVMVTALVLVVLHECQERESIRIAVQTKGKHVYLSVDGGLPADAGAFKPWRLGELRLRPTNGDGITLAVVDALARLQHGRLSVSTGSSQRHGFRLILKV